MRWRDFDTLPSLPDDFFECPRRVHFIGIGGIGMSALARMLHARGHAVSGSDAREAPLLDKLRAQGIAVAIGHDAHNLQAADAVIWGSAIAPDNPERAAAQRLNIPQWHRAQLLAYFVNGAEYSIAVSGTHGKSTTSAMIAHILTACGRNPSALLGAEYPPFGSNVRLGDPDLLVVEADESDGSFTLLKPHTAVVTNVEPEHLENYDDSEAELWRAFAIFVENARQAVVLNGDAPQVWRALQPRRGRVAVFGGQSAAAWPALQVGAPGRHNRSNALAALEAALPLGVEPAQAVASLADFHGVARRFERKGEASGVLVYDDYAHHPTEIESTLRAAREYLQRPIVAIFQPHRYTRTQQMGAALGAALAGADRVIVTQLYSAFEEPIEGVSGRLVFDGLRAARPELPARYAESLSEARQIAREWMQTGDVVFTMGAGDVNTLGPLLLEDLR
jgi:UDP-N-acetylmuramate--alanine ligase